jgi:GNAT superfamily N-acetyltransferase
VTGPQIAIMRFHTVVPILYSSNISRSLSYYREVLCFESQWAWGTPPSFGGISKNGVEIFFCENGQGHPGTWMSIMVDDVDQYFDLIREKGAKILCQPENREWGIREMLVEDPDGHRIRFGHSVTNRAKSQPLASPVRLVARMPTPDELHQLVTAVGWSQPEENASPEIPRSSVAQVLVAEDSSSGQIIGCAFLLTDHAGFYYIKNVIVLPDWQGKQVGTALMAELTRWLDQHAPDKSLVALHTGESLAPFYRRFGFAPAYSMQRRIRKPEE